MSLSQEALEEQASALEPVRLGAAESVNSEQSGVCHSRKQTWRMGGVRQNAELQIWWFLAESGCNGSTLN